MIFGGKNWGNSFVYKTSRIFNPVGVANFYIGLGFALFLSGVVFFIIFFKYKEEKSTI